MQGSYREISFCHILFVGLVGRMLPVLVNSYSWGRQPAVPFTAKTQAGQVEIVVG